MQEEVVHGRKFFSWGKKRKSALIEEEEEEEQLKKVCVVRACVRACVQVQCTCIYMYGQ